MSSSNSASATVMITVLDINDHTPTFDQLLYVVNISESAEVNDSVINLRAVDRDEVKYILWKCEADVSITSINLGCTWTL